MAQEEAAEGCPGSRGVLTVSCWSLGSISLTPGLPRAGEGPAAGREGMAGCGQELPAPCYPGGRPVSPAPRVTSPGPWGPARPRLSQQLGGTPTWFFGGRPGVGHHGFPWCACLRAAPGSAPELFPQRGSRLMKCSPGNTSCQRRVRRNLEPACSFSSEDVVFKPFSHTACLHTPRAPLPLTLRPIYSLNAAPNFSTAVSRAVTAP